MKNSPGEYKNLHQNALSINLGTQKQQIDVEVNFLLEPSKVPQYANSHFDIAPRVVVEGELRYHAVMNEYNSLDDLVSDVNIRLHTVGINVISVTPLIDSMLQLLD